MCVCVCAPAFVSGGGEGRGEGREGGREGDIKCTINDIDTLSTI